MKKGIVFVMLFLVWNSSFHEAGAGEVYFQFNYDSTFVSSASTNYTAAVNDFNYVGNYLTSMIDSSVGANVTVIVDVSGYSDSQSGTLASAGPTFYGFADSFNKAATQTLIQTGTNPAGTGNAVASADINFGATWGFNGSVSGSQYDFRNVLLHEMTHALGFTGFIQSDGGTSTGNGFYGWMDQYLYGYNSATSQYQKLIDYSGPNLVAMPNATGALVDNTHPVLYGGPNVMSYLSNQMQAMYTPSTYAEGSSIYHYNIPGSLMYYAVSPGLKATSFSDLDLAFLKDMGYLTVPEPGTYALAWVSTMVIGVIVRHQKKREKAN